MLGMIARLVLEILSKRAIEHFGNQPPDHYVILFFWEEVVESQLAPAIMNNLVFHGDYHNFANHRRRANQPPPSSLKVRMALPWRFSSITSLEPVQATRVLPLARRVTPSGR